MQSNHNVHIKCVEITETHWFKHSNGTYIQTLLHNLETNKAPGPDGIHPLVLKHCSFEIAPILKVTFEQSLNTGNIPSDWLLANMIPVTRKAVRISLQIIAPSYLPLHNESLKQK